MMSQNAIRDVVIIGGETVGWLLACLLSKRLGKSGLKVHVVEPETAVLKPSSLLTLPMARLLHQQLGLDSSELIARCHGQVIFATCFSDWVGQGHRYCHGLSRSGAMINGVDFHHYLSRLHHAGETVSPEDFSVAIHAARQCEGRTGVSIPATGLDAAHALNLHPQKYRQLLRHTALKQKVIVYSDAPTHLQRHPESGKVQALGLANGHTLTGDFFFDCSGPEGWLMNQLDSVWRELPGIPAIDRISIHSRQRQPNGATNQVCRKLDGWTRRIPLAGSETFEYHYSSDFLSAEDAAQAVLKDNPQAVVSQHVRRTGALTKPWLENCVALGAAAGFAGDWLIPETQVWQKAISLWMDLYPDKGCDPVLSQCFNRVVGAEFDRIAEVHGVLAGSASAEGVWEKGSGPTDGSLNRRQHVFQQIGRVPMGEAEVLSTGAWAALMIGLQVWPQRYDPLADALPLKALTPQLEKLQSLAGEAARDQLAGVLQ